MNTHIKNYNYMSDRSKIHPKATKAIKVSTNPRKDRGKTQRIYLLKIHDVMPIVTSAVTSTVKHKKSDSTSSDSDLDSESFSDSSDIESSESSNLQSESQIVDQPNTLERKFDLCGTTGNVYTVTINNNPVCTCPDHEQRHNRCKHIFFILIQVMKVKKENEDKLEYSDDELQNMFANMPKHMMDIQTGVKADSSLLSKYSNLKVKTNADGSIKRQNITSETRCPVCLDLLKDTTDPTSHCKYGCGTVVHNECARIYNEHRKNTGYSAICFVCQRKWNQVDESTNSYLNIQ